MEVALKYSRSGEIVESYFLIVFYPTVQQRMNANSHLTIAEISKDVNLKRIRQLESELTQTHSDISAIAEDQDAFNEELKARMKSSLAAARTAKP